MTRHSPGSPGAGTDSQADTGQTDGKGGADQVRELAAEVKGSATRLAKENTRRFAEARKDAAANFIEALADAATSGREELDKHGYSASSSALGRVADDARGIARNLADRSPDELIANLQGYARQHPTLFFGAAFIAGLGAARFLKSSAERDSATSNTSHSAATQAGS